MSVTQKCLCRNAAAKSASAAKPRLPLDHDGLETQLGSANRGDIPTRSRTDDRDVEGRLTTHRYLKKCRSALRGVVDRISRRCPSSTTLRCRSAKQTRRP